MMPYGKLTTRKLSLGNYFPHGNIDLKGGAGSKSAPAKGRAGRIGRDNGIAERIIASSLKKPYPVSCSLENTRRRRSVGNVGWPLTA
jgi:hypothetical protein